jgi:hypothetical protein
MRRLQTGRAHGHSHCSACAPGLLYPNWDRQQHQLAISCRSTPEKRDQCIAPFGKGAVVFSEFRSVLVASPDKYHCALPQLGSSARPSFGKVTIKPPGSGPNLQAGKCNGYTIQLPDGRTVVAALNETEESAQFSAALRAMGKVGADVQRVVNNSAPLQTFTGKVVNDSLSYVAFSINATSGRADLLLNSPLNKLYYTLTNAPGVGHVVLKVRKAALSGHHSAPDKGPTPPIIGKRRLLQSTPLDGDRTVRSMVD